MASINVPKEVLQNISFKSLPAKEKEEYLNNLLVKILELNPEGITISQIKESTGFTYSTIWHHLEMLKCTSLCRKISRGKIDVYYSFGVQDELKEYPKGKVNYTVSTVSNPDGNFVCIHESRENSLGSRTVLRGISLPIELIDSMVEILKKVKSSRLGRKDKK